jgi:predicted ChrR family anti-sigma factor
VIDVIDVMDLSRSLILKDLFNPEKSLEHLVWQPFRPGVEIYQLYGDGSGAGAALLRYQPGASVPQHSHTGFEHILVLSGAQTDINGKHEVGTLVINPPGTAHTVASESGCIVLAIWEKPIQINTKD